MYMTASKRAGKKQCPGTHRIFVNVLPHHADLLIHHVSLQCFSKFFPATLTFRVMRNKFSALKTCFNANMHSHCWWSNSPLSAQQSSSPLPTQQSSSTHPAGDQTFPFPPSGHPLPSPFSGHLPPLLVANLSPLRPAVLRSWLEPVLFGRSLCKGPAPP